MASFSSPQPFFIPRDQIGSEDGDRWYLTVAKDQIDAIGWDERPADYTGPYGSSREQETAGYEQVMDVDRAKTSTDRGMGTDTQTIQVHKEELDPEDSAAGWRGVGHQERRRGDQDDRGPGPAITLMPSPARPSGFQSWRSR